MRRTGDDAGLNGLAVATRVIYIPPSIFGICEIAGHWKDFTVMGIIEHVVRVG